MCTTGGLKIEIGIGASARRVCCAIARAWRARHVFIYVCVRVRTCTEGAGRSLSGYHVFSPTNALTCSSQLCPISFSPLQAFCKLSALATKQRS